MKKHPYLYFIIISCVLLITVIFSSHFYIENQAQGKIYTSIVDTPAKKIGLLLGCSAKRKTGGINLFFKYRIEAAYQLLKANKIQYLIISGDNSKKNYDEPSDMKMALIKRGIEASRLIADYAGFRTLDSVVRANKIFSANDILIISQAFHNKRALYIAQYYGISAIAYNAQDVYFYDFFKIKTTPRELLARVKMMLDLYLLKTQPKFLGEKIKI